MSLTDHFTLEELTHSNYAVRNDIDNSIDINSELHTNILRLANTLEEVRALLRTLSSKKIYVNSNSGYRCLVLNTKIGGSGTSVHVKALADDFTARRFGTPREIVQAISESDIEFDQLICEFNSWVHLGLSEVTPRRQILEAKRVDGKTTYLPFEVT